MTTVACEQCGRRNRVPVATKGKPRCAHCKQFLPWIVDADDTDFAQVAEQASIPVLVDLWAEWCRPCRMVSPALVSLAREQAGQLKLVKVDVDRAPQLSLRFAVQAIPTLLVMNRGTVVARQTGAAPINVLRDWLNGALSSLRSADTQGG
jgi:thioredoxin 2